MLRKGTHSLNEAMASRVYSGETLEFIEETDSGEETHSIPFRKHHILLPKYGQRIFIRDLREVQILSEKEPARDKVYNDAIFFGVDDSGSSTFLRMNSKEKITAYSSGAAYCEAREEDGICAVDVLRIYNQDIPFYSFFVGRIKHYLEMQPLKQI